MLIPLKCEIHRLCQKCLQEKARRDGPDDMYVCDARECTSTGAKSKLPIQMFVDNSNIWIQAKKLGSKIKNLISPDDHRVRINYGQLTDVVEHGRVDAIGTLYGSEPPKIDHVWNKIEERGWRVEILQKSSHTGKEKEVDSTMFRDILALATVPPAKQSTIILISGDRDMRPAVKEILQKGWKVEIWMWVDSIAKGLKKLTKEYENLSIIPLDEHWKEVVFYEYVVTNPLVSSDSSAVLTVTRGKFDHTQPLATSKTYSTWWDQLEQLSKWPVQYKWMEDDEARHLQLVFRGLKKNELLILVTKFKENKILLQHVERAEVYDDFKERQKRVPAKRVSDKEGWGEVVTRKSRSKPTNSKNNSSAAATPTPVRTVQPQPVCTRKEKCCSGKNCEDGLKCNYCHDKDDIKYFRWRKGAGNLRRKTRQCKDYPKCANFSIQCNFAHEDSDRWCLKCHMMGHFREKCPNPECQHPKHTQP